MYISYCPNHFTGSCLRFLHLVQCLSINFPLLLYLYLRDQLIDPRTSAQCAQCVPVQPSVSSLVIQSSVSSQCIQPSVSSSAQWTCSQPNERLYISMWTRFPVDILHFSVWTTTKNASFVYSTFPSQSEEVLMAAPSCATYI